ncbi:MAG: ChaN family lipoprotein [Bacteroidia bacterium]|nr:ChaN family lipoprotein [Bacteroidia bacterium]
MKKLYLVILLAVIFFSFGSDKPAYRIYNPKGKEMTYSAMIEELKNADIILFGELHDNPVVHWLELEVAREMYKDKKDRLVLGAEMFETDNQVILNEFLDSTIAENKFEDDARLWKNYKTDYKPLLNFAKKNKLKFIATNVPRRYAAVVFSKGFEGLNSLSADAKKFLPPLPVKYDSTLACYKNMLDMKASKGMGPQHNNKNLPKAQAIKDATMAYNILQNWKHGKQMIHYNGSYHSDNHEGIAWYLKQMDKNLKIVTISSVYQDNLDSLKKESYDLGDFIIAVEEDMTRTN